MPSNYDQLTFNNGEYIPQYAGVPLKELQNTADVLSTRHYGNLAQASQLQILANQMKAKLLPGARPAVDAHITAIDEALQDMAANGGENSTARINALATSLQGNEGLIRAMDRSNEVKKELELEAQIRANGGMPIRKQGLREQMEQASLDSDFYQTPYQSTVEPYEDPTTHMEKIWKITNPDSIEGMLRAAPKSRLQDLLPQALKDGQIDLPLFFEAVTKAGISQGKIQGLLDNAWSSYKLTPAYKQQKDLIGKDDAAMKKEFYKHGLMRVFENISREYRPTPAWAGKEGDQAPSGQAAYVDGQPVETPFDYNEDGTAKTIFGRNFTEEAYQNLQKTHKDPKVVEGASKTYTPQYIQDYKTMLEIEGKNPDVAPDSKEAQTASLMYKGLIQQRISNPVKYVMSKEQLDDATAVFKKNWSTREYMDMATGEVIPAKGKDGRVSDEFVELTGGDASKFEVSGKYDPKNHTSLNAAATRERWATPYVVTAVVDGESREFLASEQAGVMSPVALNENAIYTTTNTRPGQWSELSPGIKARELHGAQWDAVKGKLTEEQQALVQYPIEAIIEGKKMLFTSPKDLATELASRGILLNKKK